MKLADIKALDDQGLPNMDPTLPGDTAARGKDRESGILLKEPLAGKTPIAETQTAESVPAERQPQHPWWPGGHAWRRRRGLAMGSGSAVIRHPRRETPAASKARVAQALNNHFDDQGQDETPISCEEALPPQASLAEPGGGNEFGAPCSTGVASASARSHLHGGNGA